VFGSQFQDDLPLLAGYIELLAGIVIQTLVKALDLGARAIFVQ